MLKLYLAYCGFTKCLFLYPVILKSYNFEVFVCLLLRPIYLYYCKANQKGFRKNYSIFIYVTISCHCNKLCFLCCLVSGILFSKLVNSRIYIYIYINIYKNIYIIYIYIYIFLQINSS